MFRSLTHPCGFVRATVWGRRAPREHQPLTYSREHENEKSEAGSITCQLLPLKFARVGGAKLELAPFYLRDLALSQILTAR